MLTLYLAGAIRDNHPEDIEWRERLIDLLASKCVMVRELIAGKDVTSLHPLVRILNPLANKTFTPLTGAWRTATIPCNSKGIVSQDFWCVRRADIIVANFSSMVQGYPSIGTVMEVGAAVGIGGKLIYSIIDPSFSGHSNLGVFDLHPFLKEVSTEVFPSERECEEFLDSHIAALAGYSSRFGGVTGHEGGSWEEADGPPRPTGAEWAR